MLPVRQIYGVICEYNPFHNGHHHLLRQIRAAGGCIVAVMSGAFVQRGEPAVVDKRTRTRCALMGGADLVLELPAVWACSGAESFAAAGIAMLNALGCVEQLAYGSEHPDAALQRQVAQTLDSPAFSAQLPALLADGRSFASAREAAVRLLCGDRAADLLRCPNDTLGIEYQKALLRSGASIRPHPFPRLAVAHDSTAPSGAFASASLLRTQLQAGAVDPALLPDGQWSVLQQALETQGGCPDIERLARAALARLRLLSPAETARLPDLSEGLEHRLLNAAGSAESLADLYRRCKTKRYSHARIRRIVLAALMGCTASDRALPVPYIRVLGLNDRGRAILRTAHNTASLPVVTRPAEIARLDASARRIFALECAASDLWGLCTPVILPAGADFTGEVIYISSPS